MKHPGPALRAIRERRGIGIRELALELGIPKSTLSRWERGIARVPHESLERWALHLGHVVDVIVRPAAQHATVVDADWTDEQGALVRTVLERVAALSDREARMLRAMLETAPGR